MKTLAKRWIKGLILAISTFLNCDQYLQFEFQTNADREKTCSHQVWKPARIWKLLADIVYITGPPKIPKVQVRNKRR